VEAFTLGCRTCHWLLWLNCSAAIKKFKQLYDSAYHKTNIVPINEDTVDSIPLSPGKCKLVPIDKYLVFQLSVEQAIIRCYYPHLNVYYSPTGTHLRNSLVTYWLCNNPQEHICYGSIQLIIGMKGRDENLPLNSNYLRLHKARTVFMMSLPNLPTTQLRCI
jgi:hypothetical protein